MKLKWHLIALVLAAVLPVLIFAGFMFRRQVGLQREAVLRGMLDWSRAFSLAVDREIGIVRATLEGLATSSYLDAGDFESFYDLSMQAVAWDPQKRRIILFDRSGQQIINTSRPFGEPLPNPLSEPVPQRPDTRYPEVPVGAPDSVKQALQGQFVVSDMFVALSSNRPSIAIGVPVMREDGRTTYALAMSIEPAVLTDLLLQQSLPADWLGLIVDRRGIVISRTIEPERFIGRLANPQLTAQTKSLDEAWGRRSSPEEGPLYQAFTRSSLTGWSVSIEAPQSAIDGPLLRSEAFLASGGVILLLLGLSAARLIGSRIAAPITKLAASAEAIQRGEGIELNGSAVREVSALHEAFLVASTVAREAAAEHQRRLVAEARELEAKAAEQRIMESESKLREYAHMLELAPVLARDQEGRVIFWNRGMESVYGWTKEQALGRICHELLHTQFPEPLADIDRRLASAGEWKGELKQRTRSGEEICVLGDWIVQRDENGNVRVIIEVSDDITERKRAENALRDADRRKDEFLAMLGHELRNPLSVISTVVQLLNRKETPDPDVQDMRNTIKLELSQLARLLDDLLDISRIGRGLIRLKKEPCDLAMVVRQVAEGRRPILEKSSVDLSVQLPPQPVWVMGDRTRLAQIVGNLLDNANKFTDAGGQVTVRLVEQGTAGSAVLTIRDSGMGMEPEMLKRVFEPFTQAERTIDRSPGGLGLGLALVKRLVDLHGGEVLASSAGAGFGSEFTIRLSLAHEPRSVTKPIELGGNLAERRRILVIEDNLAAARNLRMLLTEIGHAVEVAHNGPDGVEVARRFRPEIVLCDIGLPGLDGYAVARALREEPGLSNAYLIAVSGYGQDADQRRASEEGFNAYLTKPIDFNELEQLLTKSSTYERPGQIA